VGKVSSSPTYFTPMKAVCTLSLLLFGAAFAVFGCESTSEGQGRTDFEAANSAIGVFSTDVGFGNTPAATSLAKKFALRLKKLDAYNRTTGDDGESPTRGNFLTYCEVNGSDVVFLVQAPNLDGSEGDARKMLVQLAWQSAQEAAGKPAGTNLVIALRGRNAFGVVGKGNASASVPDAVTSADERELYAYFASAPLES
jgi:hypothetical protein